MLSKFKILFICCFVCFFTSISYAENNYILYPTQNHFTQILLDTRDGRIWQSHTAVNATGFRGTLTINDIPLTASPEPGRFILSPTGNMYNFILLDTIDGRTWQIQWSMDAENRGIVGKISQ